MATTSEREPSDCSRPSLSRGKEPGKAAIAYDASGQRTSVTAPNGITRTWAYDASNRVTQIAAVKGSTTLVRLQYKYAPPDGSTADSHLRHEVTDLAGNTTRYGYDKLNRLVKARTTNAAGSLVVEYEYSYDGAGNRLTRTTTKPSALTPLSTTDKYAYNAANQLTEANSITQTYDANGNLTGNLSGATFSYNAVNQTTSITPSAETGKEPANFVYRGNGQTERVGAGPMARHVTTDGDVCLPLAGCQDDPDALVASATYQHSILGLASEALATGTTNHFTRDNTGDLISLRARDAAGAAKTYYYITDAIGSVIALADDAGNIAATYSYDPNGRVTEATGNIDNPHLFAGYYMDGTGLYHAGERYYDPNTSRWSQQDPTWNHFDPQQWNRYTYVGADPINYTDPTGLGVRDWFKRCAGPTTDLVFSVGGAIGGATTFIRGAAFVAGAVTGVGAAAGAVVMAVGAATYVYSMFQMENSARRLQRAKC